MNATLEALFDLTVRCLLKAYPFPFRSRFGDEMLQVYRALAHQVLQEAGASGLLLLWLRTIWDGISGALVQWGQLLTKRGVTAMNLDLMDVSDGTTPLNARRAALAAVPFLIFGLASLALKLNIYRPGSSISLGRMLVTHPYLVFNWVILLGLAAGILCGFPRWAFPYLGWALLDVLWLANLSAYGQPVNLMWLPVAAVLIIPLLIRRALHAKRLILPGAWRDLTLLPLGIYIPYTSFFMIYEENHHPALLFFVAATTLAAALGAWGYFRIASPLRRVLALTGGMAMASLLNLWSELTWDFAAYYGLPKSSPVRNILVAVIFLLSFAAVMIGLGWLAEYHSRHKAA